jgi:hypothetical protein
MIPMIIMRSQLPIYYFISNNRYTNRPMMSSAGLYDPTEVMNASEMWRCQKEGWIKLAFYLISFFYYLYRYDSLGCV